jgi:hypothetical protein
MSVMVNNLEDTYIPFTCPHCGFSIKRNSTQALQKLLKHEVNISIDEKAVKTKLHELEKLDFYKKIVTYAKLK